MKHLVVFAQIVVGILVVFSVLALFYLDSMQPRNDRQWKQEIAILADTFIDENEVTITNIRNNTYTGNGLQVQRYYDDTFFIDELESVWLLVEPFKYWDKAAHTLLSFGFSDGRYVSISVEARMEHDEDYDALLGLFNNFELMYIWATERDFFTRRVLYMDNPVYLYELNISEELKHSLFLDLVAHTHTLQSQPEFYHTFSSSCTSTLVRHFNRVSHGALGADLAHYLPGMSDEYAFAQGWLVTDAKDEKELLAMHNITQEVRNYAESPEFGRLVRS